MKTSDIKQLIIDSLDTNSKVSGIPDKFEMEGIDFDFSDDFEDKVIDRLFGIYLVAERSNDFVRSLSFLVSRVAITGIAAILILLLSIFITEGGSFSINSLVGLGDVYDEGLICLLGGN